MRPLLFPDAPFWIAAPLTLGRGAVDIFFILSGFILARVYGAIPATAVPNFWLRRICRVYPLHLSIMAALALAALTTTALHINRTDHDWPVFPLVLALLQPYVPGAAGWNAPSWSVGIELACYALFPFVARPLFRLPAGAVAAIAVLLALAEAVVLTRFGGEVQGIGALLRGLAGFHLGVALAILAPRLPPRVVPALCWACVLVFAIGLTRVQPVPAVLAVAVLIVGLAQERGLVARALSAAWLVWLGQISFSIYLLHAPLLVLIGRVHLPGGPAVQAAVLVAILLPMSALSWRYIEQPGRRLPAIIARRGPVTA